MKLESNLSEVSFKSESLPNYPHPGHHGHGHGLTEFQLQNQGLNPYMHDPHVHPSHYQQYFSTGGFVENWGGFHGGYL